QVAIFLCFSGSCFTFLNAGEYVRVSAVFIKKLCKVQQTKYRIVAHLLSCQRLTTVSMNKTIIAGIGKYVPENVVTNEDLTRVMDTSDAWIQERTGICERRYATRFEETTATIGANAARLAMERAGVEPADIDFIIFA